MAGRGVRGGGHAWQGGCVVRGACMAGGSCLAVGVCMHGRGRVWQGGHAWVGGRHVWHARSLPSRYYGYGITVNERAVHILLECIPVLTCTTESLRTCFLGWGLFLLVPRC